MKCKCGGSYCRDGMSVEVFCSRSDSYVTIIDKACIALDIERKEQKFSLFTVNGARIIEDDEWTLGDYLQRLHKSDARIGLGELHDDSPSTSVCVYCIACVSSRPRFYIKKYISLVIILQGRPSQSRASPSTLPSYFHPSIIYFSCLI